MPSPDRQHPPSAADVFRPQTRRQTAVRIRPQRHRHRTQTARHHHYAIDITEFDAPKAVIDVRCSKGTYIRTLSEDIAKHIGTFAHLTALRRTETAGFTIRESHTLEALAELNETERDALLLPCDVLVRHFPKIELNDRAVEMLQHGQRPQFSDGLPNDKPFRIYSENGRFIGLAHYQAEIGRLKALRLMDTKQV